LPEADLEQLNPASKLKDGQKISIPYKAGMSTAETATQVAQTSQTAQTSQGSLSGQAAQVAQSPQTSAASGSAPSSNTGKININTAGAAELDNLPGVGPALAARIIQYRTDNGPFSNPEALQDVSGIGPKTYEKMASMVTTGP
jgi:competence protein ComEA